MYRPRIVESLNGKTGVVTITSSDSVKVENTPEGYIKLISSGCSIDITTEEQVTHESFFGMPVYVKGYKGEVPRGEIFIESFFPIDTCHIVSYGGSSSREVDTADHFPFPFSGEFGVLRMVFRSRRDLCVVTSGDNANINIRIWVKYTHE
jgi:hypothetical protein